MMTVTTVVLGLHSSMSMWGQEREPSAWYCVVDGGPILRVHPPEGSQTAPVEVPLTSDGGGRPTSSPFDLRVETTIYVTPGSGSGADLVLAVERLLDCGAKPVLYDGGGSSGTVRGR